MLLIWIQKPVFLHALCHAYEWDSEPLEREGPEPGSSSVAVRYGILQFEFPGTDVRV
jgi:hypothetical protein